VTVTPGKQPSSKAPTKNDKAASTRKTPAVAKSGTGRGA